MPEINVNIVRDEIAVGVATLAPLVAAVHDPQIYAPLQGDFVVQAGEIINGQKLLMISNGLAYHFDPSNEANIDKVIGFSKHAANAGTYVAVRRMGPLASMVLVPNAVYYAGPNGSVTATAPTSGILLRVGVAKDASTLIVDLGVPIIINNS